MGYCKLGTRINLLHVLTLTTKETSYGPHLADDEIEHQRSNHSMSHS